MRKAVVYVFLCLVAGLLRPPAYAQTAEEANKANEAKFERQRQEVLYRQLQQSQSWVDGSGYVPSVTAARTGKGGEGMETTTKLVLSSMMLGITDDIIPIIPRNADAAYIRERIQQSAIGGLSLAIATMYTTPPANFAYWLNDTGQTLGFLPRSAYAQGIGFTGLTPLLPIWKAFRNISYVLLAMVLIVVGFMVMLRKKIDPKTVVTVQNALPKIVVTLILITFSYAIAGLMIDLMYLVIVMGKTLIESAVPGKAEISMFGIKPDVVNGGFMDLVWALFAPLINNAGTTGNLAKMLETGASGDVGRAITEGVLGIVGVIVLVAQPGIAILGNLLALIVAIAFLIGLIRIFFMLLSAYIQIILAVLVGPIQILLDAIPGGDGFGSWIKNLFANLIPFPITVIMLLIGNAIANSNLGANLWQAPFIPKIGNQAGGFAVTILWIGFILSIPQIANGIKEAIKAKPAIPAGAGAILGPVGTGAGMAMQLGHIAMVAHPVVTHFKDKWKGAQLTEKPQQEH